MLLLAGKKKAETPTQAQADRKLRNAAAISKLKDEADEKWLNVTIPL